MINTLIGKKLDQTQKFLENGKRVPVTLISVADNAVLQVKTQATDAYTAVQLGFGTKKKPTKASVGHAKKAGFENVSAVVKEVRMADADEVPAAGEFISLDAVFKPGDIVSVTGTSKGKGFAGVVKRHNFRGGPKTHGQSDRERAPGSIGQTTTPGRVYRGKRMAGRMGSDQKTLPNLTVMSVDLEKKVLLVTGLVPGHRQAIVSITKTGERKNFVELIEEKVKREAREAIEAQEAEKAAKIAEEEAAKAAAAAPVEETQTEEAPVEEVKVEAEVPAEEPAQEVVEETKAEDASASSAQEPVEEVKEEEKVEEEVATEAVNDASTDSAQEEEKK